MMQRIESNKPFLIFFLGSLIFVISGIYANLQAQDLDSFRDLRKDEVLTQNPQTKNLNYRPGEILVKFKDEVKVLSKAKGRQQQTGVPQIDRVLEKYEVYEIKQLFPNATRQLNKGKLKTYSGEEIERPNLHNMYHLKLNEQDYGKEVGIIEELEQQQDVEYAEPNYIIKIVGEVPEDDAFINLKEPPVKYKAAESSSSAVIPNDPLYSEQSNITATNIDKVWADTTGSPDDVIAILDTGVDMDHPDLVNKIWINEAELNGIEGVDDDGNGFIDDIHGWDFINNDNDPDDDNSHGTHVAGIAAAEANNGIGIAGVNWHAKVMPVKVFQSSGFSDAATIIQGINYAFENGADVLNMSFGSYSRSLAMEEALAVAYSNAVLVAAAGNDGVCIGPGKCEEGNKIGAPFYPASISYVLGIEASASFSNHDQDGPTFSRYSELWNYEIIGPGSAIISTIPGGSYRNYSGTSMSAPLISGAVLLYQNLKPLHSQELMWGNLINTSSSVYIDLFEATSIEPKPVLGFVSHTVVDTLEGTDGDGSVDAGETFELWLEVRNTWGPADSVNMMLDFGEFEDSSVGTIEIDSSFIGGMGSYARHSNRANPFRVSVESDVAHNRDIVFVSKMWNEGSIDTVRQEIVLKVQNGIELIGVLDSTFTLRPDKMWLVNNSFKVGSTGKLQILPGVRLELKNQIVNNGIIEGFGTADSNIFISGPENIVGGELNFTYTNFTDMLGPFGSNDNKIMICNFCEFSEIRIVENSFPAPLFWGFGTIDIRNSIIQNSSFTTLATGGSMILKKTNIYNVFTSAGEAYNTSMNFSELKYNNFLKINFIASQFAQNYSSIFVNTNNVGEFNNFISFDEKTNMIRTGAGDRQSAPNNYWGTTDSVKIQDFVYDFWDDATLKLLDYMPILNAPSDSAHGVVWKVLVNGVDPQDQWENLDPVGVGATRFDVYFNRPMDTEFTPQLSFGVRQPYTQNFVADSAQWSADSTIWTAYGSMDLTTGDGINRIRVAGAQDPEGFEIPIEDQRFEFVIDAAGAASLDFIANAGLGKIDLEWKDPESVEDLLGYNIYRFENATDSTYTDTVRINNELVTDTTYTDFEVEPDSNYYYQYTVVRTSLDESNRSRVAAAKALTASAGDANGDLSVNVLDITTTVDFILGNNPTPFIFEAADINTDGAINILDVVSIVDLILQAKQPSFASNPEEKASLVLKDGRLVLETPTIVSGFQFDIAGVGEEATFKKLAAFGNFELAHSQKEDTLKIIAYSMSGQSLAAGSYELLEIEEDNATIENALLSMPDGNAVVITGFEEKPEIPEQYYLSYNYPNPFNPTTKIQYELPNRSEVTLQVFDVLGRKVSTLVDEAQNAGRYTLTFDAGHLASGVYFYRIKANNFVKVRKMLLIK